MAPNPRLRQAAVSSLHFSESEKNAHFGPRPQGPVRLPQLPGTRGGPRKGPYRDQTGDAVYRKQPAPKPIRT